MSREYVDEFGRLVTRRSPSPRKSSGRRSPTRNSGGRSFDRRSKPIDMNSQLVSQKYFVRTLPAAPADEDEASRLYSQYRREFEQRVQRKFAEANVKSEWLKDNYDEQILEDRRSAVLAPAALEQRASAFVEAVKNGQLVALNYDLDTPDFFKDLLFEPSALTSSSSSAATASPSSSSTPLPASCTRSGIARLELSKTTVVWASKLPSTILRSQLLPLFSSRPGFITMRMTLPMLDPVRASSSSPSASSSPSSSSPSPMLRSAFITFDSHQHAQETITALNKTQVESHTLELTLSTHHQRVRVAPPHTLVDERVSSDIELATELITRLDSQRGLQASESILSQNLISFGLHTHDLRHLNLLLAYLRDVHVCCFYCARLFVDHDHMLERCGVTHLRHTDDLLLHQKLPAPNSEDAAAWQSAIESRIKGLALPNESSISQPEADESEQNTPSKRLQQFQRQLAEREEALCRQQLTEIEAGVKYRCAVADCGKLFKGADFVIKHVANKHRALIDPELNKMRDNFLIESYLASDDKFALPLPEAVEEDHESFSSSSSSSSSSRSHHHSASHLRRRQSSRSPSPSSSASSRAADAPRAEDGAHRSRSRSRSPSSSRRHRHRLSRSRSRSPRSDPHQRRFSTGDRRLNSMAPFLPLQMPMVPIPIMTPNGMVPIMFPAAFGPQAHQQPQRNRRSGGGNFNKYNNNNHGNQNSSNNNNNNSNHGNNRRYNSNQPLVPPPNAASDPRAVRSYADVDTAVPSVDVEIDYGAF